MNLARAGLPRIVWYATSKSATSNVTSSVRKFSREPKVTDNLIVPSGVAEVPGMTPWNGTQFRFSSERGIFMSSRVLVKRMLSPLPPSIRTLLSLIVRTIGSNTRGVMPWVGNTVRVVGPIESYWDFRPFEIFGSGWSDSIDLPSDELLLPLGLVCLRPSIYHVELMFWVREHRAVRLVAGAPIGPVLSARRAF